MKKALSLAIIFALALSLLTTLIGGCASPEPGGGTTSAPNTSTTTQATTPEPTSPTTTPEPTAPPTTAAPKEGDVRANTGAGDHNLNVRSEPSTTGGDETIIGRFANGSTFTLLDEPPQNEIWFKVTGKCVIEGTTITGWSSGELIQMFTGGKWVTLTEIPPKPAENPNN